ncbi:MAG: hypothetical protein R1F52_03100 [Candidatus Nitrosoabyssus spongiisocia]|nr:MAG: hypothetical protein R1F52_03100 [Nitrosopumilaceae archaeon AB1(1)]
MTRNEIRDKGVNYIISLLSSKGHIVKKQRNGRDEYLYIEKPKKFIIKIKTLSQTSPVPFGQRDPKSINADFLIICRIVGSDSPESFIANIEKVIRVTKKIKENYWLQRRDYEEFEQNLDLLN